MNIGSNPGKYYAPLLWMLSTQDQSFQEAWLTETELTEAATRGFLCKKVFLQISQNSQENTCARVSFLIKLQAWDLQIY